MIELFSIEFWIAILFTINFFLVIVVFLLVKRINRFNLGRSSQNQTDSSSDDGEAASQSASDIISLLEPLVRESRKAAISFDTQIKEKKRLLKGLNDALDSRIISINLLLSRADAMQQKMEKRQMIMNQPMPASNPTYLNTSSDIMINQQSQIIELHSNQFDVDTIAEKLSIPKGEVQLVIDLKKKFMAMETPSG
jgi:uncharacterized protein DUF6115